ncbi:eIF4-gamma/eIF5/eIF2-epsilon-domain-containing protein [Mycena rebaudengoi]|nr:eIF4-gamma/eIF5/eIF2-epsilon-domain-containing protein [Mycena rebaudengoi]
MSLPSSTPKPSLQGVRIKARKGAHEPTVFRDQLYKHLETVQEGDFEAFATKLVQAGSTLEFLKYADALFEILLVGGLIQPGGSYIDDGAPVSPFTIFNAKEPAEVDDLKKYIEVLNKLIRRYKYLQKPLEESALPGLLQYIHRWSAAQKDKLALATGLLISQGLANASCLQSLTKDHLVKDNVSVTIVTLVFRAYLLDQSMDHLSSTLKRGGIKDLLAFFPPNKRSSPALEEHFKKEGLPQKQYAVVKESIIVVAIKARQEETPMPENELVHARPDQIEGLALREVGKYTPILQPFCNGAKTEVALINVVQVYCYEDTRIIKAFPQILKVLYNKDCISDQAIIYWHQKGSKPQGRQHFLKSTEPLVKFLQEQEEDSEEEEE